MIKGWLAVGATLFACMLLVGCGLLQEEHDAAQSTEWAQILSLQSKLNKAQSDLTQAQSQIESLEGDFTEAESQINTLESDLAAMQGKFAQALYETSWLEGQLSSLESQLESQLSDYDVLVEKVAKARIYAEMIEKYILVSFFELTAEGRIDLDHLVHYTGDAELFGKWGVFYFSDKEADWVEFFVAVGDGLWEVLR